MAFRTLILGAVREIDFRDGSRDGAIQRSLGDGERAVNARDIRTAWAGQQRRRVGIVYGLRRDSLNTVLATHYILRWLDISPLHPASCYSDGVDRRGFEHIDQVRQYLDEIGPRFPQPRLATAQVPVTVEVVPEAPPAVRALSNDEVRKAFMHGADALAGGTYRTQPMLAADFDAWLRSVQADAWAEGYQWLAEQQGGVHDGETFNPYAGGAR